MVTARAEPHPPGRALVDVAGSVVRSARLLAGGSIHQPRHRVGSVIHFADGSSARIYRETRLRERVVVQPAVLVVRFRLSFVRGRGHAWFRAESLLNTPLFVGFPGFVTKLWLAHDDNQAYRGVYEWDGPDRADAYARSLWWALAAVSERSSIRHVVIPAVRLDDVLHDPGRIAGSAPGEEQWWRPIACSTAGGADGRAHTV
jgi:hypothetical protein